MWWPGGRRGPHPPRVRADPRTLEFTLPGDRFGHSLAVGDLDDDGFADLAVGAPHHRDDGKVLIWRGSPDGLIPWHSLDQDGTGIGVGEPGDQFGWSLAVGDFDADLIDDLAIGAPGDRIGPSGDPAGAVFVFRGNVGGTLQPHATTFQGQEEPFSGESVRIGEPRPDERYGAALATGNLDDDDFADLVVGAPCDDHAGRHCAGGVYVYRGNWGSLRPWKELHDPTPGDHDAFGEAVAMGNLDHDLYDEVFVGVPLDDDPGHPDAGSVQVFTPDVNTNRLTAMTALTQSGSHSPGPDAHFGSAIALYEGAINLGIDVGAPMEESGGIRAGATTHWFDLSGSPRYWFDMDPVTLGHRADPGDRFGAALAAGRYDGQPVWAVGSPGAGAESGAVYIQRGFHGANVRVTQDTEGSRR